MPKRVILISACDALADLVFERFFENDNFYSVVALVQTKLALSTRISILNKAIQANAFYYACYMQAEICGAKLINRKNRWHRSLIYNIEERKLPILTTYNVNSKKVISFVNETKADILLSVRPGQIFKKSFINNVPQIRNLHCSKLPQYGGIGAVFQALANNEKELGCSIHDVLDEKIDSGTVIAQRVLNTIPSKSVFYHTILLYKLSQEVIRQGLSVNTMVKTVFRPHNEESSYYSWPTKRVLTKLHDTKRRMIKIKDFVSIFSDCN